MRKKIISLSLLPLLFAHLNAQTGNDFSKDVDNINKIFPAAPTANNLMKFEEVPVSYYTGIPDINIPLFNIPTNNPNVNLNVQLKYHPLSAKPEDKASETGLGWSLLAGGTITRTVRGGVADELIESTFMSDPPSEKYGIYKHENNPTYKLIFNQLTNWDLKEYAFYAAKGRYDTEYDLYQYNFMGYSGRFIIKRDPNGNFVVEKLDRNNLKITSIHSPGGEVQTITIIDDKGTQYQFRGMENSSKNVNTVKTGLVEGSGGYATNPGGGVYFTAYHLEKVKDASSNLLLTFKYDQASQVEYKDPETKTTRAQKNAVFEHFGVVPVNPDSQLPGAMEIQTVYNSASTKLLTSIAIADKGIINFTYEKGRSDSNYLNSSDLYKLKSVQSNIAGQSTNQYVDKYNFDYDYSSSDFSGTLKKLLLKKVTKVSAGSNPGEYTITYNNFNSVFKKDPWGYYKGPEPYEPFYITQDVIRSMTYPTKGKVEFDFGENIYSYFAGFSEPMEPVTGEWVDENPSFELVGLNSFSPTAKAEFFTLLSPQKVRFFLEFASLAYSSWKLTIYKKLPNNTFSPPVYFVEMGYQVCDNIGNTQCPGGGIGTEPILSLNPETPDILEPGVYYASLEGTYGPTPKPISYLFLAYTKEHHFSSYLTKKGGGLRINGIKYYDIASSTIPAKEFIYDYKDINNSQKSSGALVFPEPIFKYSEDFSYGYIDDNSGSFATYSCSSNTETNFNIIPSEKTQGSDVGYKYVTLKQIVRDNNNNITDNGKTVYTFRSPVDFPNPEMFAPIMPILPITNHDYLRGQTISEKKYDTNGKILSEITNEYSSFTFQKQEGVKAKDNFYNNIKPNYYKSKYYEGFKLSFPNIVLSTPYRYFAQYGITLPTQKTETSYFYRNGVQTSVTNTSTSAYNTLDYPSLSTQTLSDGKSTVTNYLYATEKNNQKLINANMISIPLETSVVQKMTSSDPGKTIAKTELIYDPSSSSLFPDAVTGLNIQTGTMENKIKYDQYDAKGNLLQYTTKDGIPVSIIWGYNQTLPIAKVEGVPYSYLLQLSPETADIINASNLDYNAGANNDETALLSALKKFRARFSSDARFSSLVSTYTYDPLIGVRSITPPSGVRENYIYDSAGRLEKVIDMDGKILKEMKYNYKN